MHFAIINAVRQETSIVDCVSLRDAMGLAGLRAVDHGIVMPGVMVVVYEYGLYTPPSEQSYFCINGRLYAGNAVLYGVNSIGETVSLQVMPQVVFMPSAKAVERSISLGLVQRPQTTVNGTVIWEWPQPQPKKIGVPE